MVYGHTVSALLAAEYRVGPWHDAWIFQRGLTSALFLLLSGFAFSIATTRHWPAHTALTPTVWRRVRRFGLFIVLGYALHFPAKSLAELAATTADGWKAFFAVDVLQLIGVTFIAVQALVLLVRRRRIFSVAVFALAALVLAMSPWAWGTDWTGRVPLPVASYLTSATGSLFPVFPWAAYVLIGTGTGQLYARWGAGHLAPFANRVMLAPGAALVAAVLTAHATGKPLFGAGPWDWLPTEVLTRTGACLLLLGAVAHASRLMDRLPHVFSALAQESLLVYVVHLCIVYGSIWNPGLHSFYGEALPLSASVLAGIALVAAMVGLAWQWNTLKHARPHTAHRLSLAIGASLMVLLVT
jgi:hypothetical protein